MLFSLKFIKNPTMRVLQQAENVKKSNDRFTDGCTYYIILFNLAVFYVHSQNKTFP